MGTSRAWLPVSPSRVTTRSAKGLPWAYSLARVLTLLLLAFLLLILSALIHSAAAATDSGRWLPIAVPAAVAFAAALLACFGPLGRWGRWRRLCVLDGIASLCLVGFAMAGLVKGAEDPAMPVPVAPVLGVAIASGVLAIVGLLLVLLSFAAWHLLSHHGPARHHQT